jgi:hypothetical protein
MSNLAKSSQGLQLSFDEIGGDEQEWREAERAIDLIQERYGSQSIGAASTLTEKGLRPKEKGSQ